MPRWQYHVVDLGAFKAAERMTSSFGYLGSQGWELVAMYDKASNWWVGMEKGIAIFKRMVPDGDDPDGPWGQWHHADYVDQPSTLGSHPDRLCAVGMHHECQKDWCTCACHQRQVQY